MNDIKKAMKYSLILGLIGAVLLPVLYEIYANISDSFALVLLFAYVLVSAVIFSKLDGKSAFLGITVNIVYSVPLAMVAYVVIHPFTEKLLTKNSVYFQLSLKDQARFFGYAGAFLVLIYVICFAKKGIAKAFRTFKANRDKAGAYINDAFSEEDNLK